jgi:hypothetical protein
MEGKSSGSTIEPRLSKLMRRFASVVRKALTGGNNRGYHNEAKASLYRKSRAPQALVSEVKISIVPLVWLCVSLGL